MEEGGCDVPRNRHALTELRGTDCQRILKVANNTYTKLRNALSKGRQRLRSAQRGMSPCSVALWRSDRARIPEEDCPLSLLTPERALRLLTRRHSCPEAVEADTTTRRSAIQSRVSIEGGHRSDFCPPMSFLPNLQERACMDPPRLHVPGTCHIMDAINSCS